MDEIEEALAAGIFRGEGYVGCHLRSILYPSGRYPELSAEVKMCDRDSVETVARVWHSKVYRYWPGRCLGGRDEYHTQIKDLSRVRDKIGGWIALGLLRGEKAEQYFDAIAKCRRARRVFLKEEGRRGRPRESF